MKKTNTMNKLWLAALLVALLATLFCLSAGAETVSGTCGAEGDNLTWTLDTETGELIISGEGEMENYSYNSMAPWYSYQIKKVTIENDVTSIGECAFCNCRSLVSVTIGDSLTYIGDEAFSYCYRLVEIINKSSLSIEKGLPSNGHIAYYAIEIHSGERKIVDQNGYLFYTYEGVNYLLGYTGTETELVLPANYNGQNYEIYKSAFQYCDSLTSVTIPDSVTSIGNSAFYYCSSLTSVNIPDSVTSIGSSAFSGCNSLTNVEIGDSVMSIGSSAFTHCYSLTSITIPDSVTSIGDGAFSGCTSLTSITIPDSVTSIGDRAFYGCDNLVQIESGIHYVDKWVVDCDEDLTSAALCVDTVGIADYAFYDCDSLTSVTIPDSLTSIGNSVFRGCTSLISATIPDSVTSIGDSAFRGCTSLTSATIPNSVTSIGEYAFSGCTNLASITIPESVTSIGDDAFEDCDSLTSITIPKSVTSIGNGAFSGCTSLTSVTIGNGVTSIGNFAFYCTDITALTIPDSVTSIGWCAFSWCDSLASITVDQNNSVYHSTGNCLIETASKTLIVGCKNSVIPTNGSVTSIADQAFLLCDITSVTIPNSVTSIGNQAFYWCGYLEKITIFSKTVEIYDGEDTIHDTVTIYGYKGSTAEAYATKYGRTFVALEEPKEFLSSGTCGADGDNLTWGLTAEGELVISGEGAMADYSSGSDIPWYTYRSSIKTVTIGDSVTSIGEYAFSGCTNLASITIPDSVTSIGNGAFYYCSSLTSVYITDIASWCGISFGNIYSNPLYYTDNLYLDGELVTELVIPDSVTSIGEYAFSGCTNLASITIPDSVTSIGDFAFRECSSLTSIIIPDSVTSIGDRAFSGCSSLTSITIPDSVTSIGDYVFMGCSNLASVTIPNSVTSIGDGAFYGCTSLTSITIPDSVTSIGERAFSVCSSLTSITVDQNNSVYHSAGNCLIETASKTLLAGCKNSVIPTDGNVTSIGDDAFYGCTSLTSITIPDSVTSIGERAFSVCMRLASITVDQNNSVYHSAGNCLIETASKTLLAGCKNSVIPADGSVTSIGDWAFYACLSLTSITIPDSVTSIGERAFSDCDSLTSITIPDSVTSIGDFAFLYCDSLTSITIPDSVTSIGERAFSDCDSLTSVTVLSKTATIYDSSDTIDDGATIYGYAGSTAEAYATKYGRTFVALEEPEELMDGSLVGFQVTKGENGEFSLRAIAGLNSLDYKNFGYEVTITTKDESGNDVVKTLSGVSTKAYSSIYGGDTEYSIKEHFGYEYAGLATVTGLAVDSSYTKIEIRSFVTTLDGEVKYGKSATLLYTGVLDESEFPALELVTE